MCKNAGIINSCSGEMVHDQMDVRSTGGAGKIKGIQNQRGQRNPCDPE